MNPVFGKFLVALATLLLQNPDNANFSGEIVTDPTIVLRAVGDGCCGNSECGEGEKCRCSDSQAQICSATGGGQKACSCFIPSQRFTQLNFSREIIPNLTAVGDRCCGNSQCGEGEKCRCSDAQAQICSATGGGQKACKCFIPSQRFTQLNTVNVNDMTQCSIMGPNSECDAACPNGGVCTMETVYRYWCVCNDTSNANTNTLRRTLAQNHSIFKLRNAQTGKCLGLAPLSYLYSQADCKGPGVAKFRLEGTQGVPTRYKIVEVSSSKCVTEVGDLATLRNCDPAGVRGQIFVIGSRSGYTYFSISKPSGDNVCITGSAQDKGFLELKPCGQTGFVSLQNWNIDINKDTFE